MAVTKIKTLREVRREYILKVLRETGWDYEKASLILKVSRESLEKEAKDLCSAEMAGGPK
jgi:DNA-binding NtrC family response regulator